jgi:hypothetical protein
MSTFAAWMAVVVRTTARATAQGDFINTSETEVINHRIRVNTSKICAVRRKS